MHIMLRPHFCIWGKELKTAKNQSSMQRMCSLYRVTGVQRSERINKLRFSVVRDGPSLFGGQSRCRSVSVVWYLYWTLHSSHKNTPNTLADQLSNYDRAKPVNASTGHQVEMHLCNHHRQKFKKDLLSYVTK